MTYREPFDLARENRIRFFRDAMVGCVDDDARAVRIELVLARHEYRVVPDSTVLTETDPLIAALIERGACDCTWDLDDDGHDVVVRSDKACPVHTLLAKLSCQHTEKGEDT